MVIPPSPAGPLPGGCDTLAYPTSSDCSGGNPPAPANTDGNRGLYVYQGRGLYGVNDYDVSVQVPIGQDWARLIYAPTSLPHGGSCIEITAIHRSSPTGTRHALGLYDWCGEIRNFIWAMDMDTQAFRNSYVRTSSVSGQPGYVWQVTAEGPDLSYTDTDCWHAYVYNYSTGRWDEALASCGLSDLNATKQGVGWTMWESYQLMDVCRPYPAISARAIETYDIYNDGGYTNARWGAIHPTQLVTLISAAPNARCWHEGTYTFESYFDSNGSLYWTAHTPP